MKDCKNKEQCHWYKELLIYIKMVQGAITGQLTRKPEKKRHPVWDKTKDDEDIG